MLQIDIRSTILTAAIIAGIAAIITLFLGLNLIIKSRKIPFYGKRHDRMVRGWRLILTTILLIPLIWVILNYSEPVVYQFISPSPTTTQTPTITITPSITITPTITLTPTITRTPSITSTPSMPMDIEDEFEAEVTPNPDALFSPIQFSRRIDEDFQPVDPAVEFTNPVGQLYGTYSYNNMVDGSQWSVLWYWEDELVYYETLPWGGGSGGYGVIEWEPSSDQWRPGLYEVQIFVGSDWKVSGFFNVIGEPPTPTITPTTAEPTQTGTPTYTPTPSRTPRPTDTLWPTSTVTITLTPTITRTPRQTQAP